jgi:hypothetical protein
MQHDFLSHQQNRRAPYDPALSLRLQVPKWLLFLDLCGEWLSACAIFLRFVMLNQWHGRIVWFPLDLWCEQRTVLWLYNCLASLDGPLVTNSLFSQTCLSHLLLGVAWAVASFSRGEGRDVKHTFMGGLDGHLYGSYLQSMLKLVPWFVVTGCRPFLTFRSDALVACIAG